MAASTSRAASRFRHSISGRTLGALLSIMMSQTLQCRLSCNVVFGRVASVLCHACALTPTFLRRSNLDHLPLPYLTDGCNCPRPEAQGRECRGQRPWDTDQCVRYRRTNQQPATVVPQSYRQEAPRCEKKVPRAWPGADRMWTRATRHGVVPLEGASSRRALGPSAKKEVEEICYRN